MTTEAGRNAANEKSNSAKTYLLLKWLKRRDVQIYSSYNKHVKKMSKSELCNITNPNEQKEKLRISYPTTQRKAAEVFHLLKTRYVLFSEIAGNEFEDPGRLVSIASLWSICYFCLQFLIFF